MVAVIYYYYYYYILKVQVTLKKLNNYWYIYIYILKNLSNTVLFNQFKCNGKRQLKAGLIQVVKQLK